VKKMLEELFSGAIVRQHQQRAEGVVKLLDLASRIALDIGPCAPHRNGTGPNNVPTITMPQALKWFVFGRSIVQCFHVAIVLERGFQQILR
jgi:hypothetical protein